MARLGKGAARRISPHQASTEYWVRLGITRFWLLAAFSVNKPDKADSSKTKAPGSEWVEPLSERELEVLQRIAEGLTNQEIADRLYLSLNSVKVHTRNIYGKLNVHSRTQAIAGSQELGLLPR